MKPDTLLTELLTPQPAPQLTDQSRPVLDDDFLVDLPPPVAEALRARRQFGLDKYGTLLHSHNGRDPMADALQEALDLTVYLRQAVMERPSCKSRRRLLGDAVLLADRLLWLVEDTQQRGASVTTLQPNERRLARRAIACKGWRWRRGMVAICDNGWPVLRGTDTWEWDAHGGWPGGPPRAELLAALQRELLPDLTDPATLGCLLALVREAWGDPELQAACVRDDNGAGWIVQRSYLPDGGMYTLSSRFVDTEAEALVAALEAAPC